MALSLYSLILLPCKGSALFSLTPPNKGWCCRAFDLFSLDKFSLSAEDTYFHSFSLSAEDTYFHSVFPFSSAKKFPPRMGFVVLGVPMATSAHLRRILQRSGNTAPARDRMQTWMPRERDDDGPHIVCEIVNRFIRGERLEALAHGDLHLLPKKTPHWLRGHGFLPPSQFALWPGTSVLDCLRVLNDWFWQRCVSGGEALPILDDVRHAFQSPDHVSWDSGHRVVAYEPNLCRLHGSLVEDMRLDMGGTDDVDHAIGWFDAGLRQGCPPSVLDYAPMGEVRVRMVSKAYPGVHTPAGLLHSVDDTVWLGGS